MAKKSKSSQNDETPEVVEVEEVTADVTPDDTADAPEVDIVAELEEPEVEADLPPEPEVEEPAIEIEETPQPPAQTPMESHDSASNSVFLPAILGGIIAAGLGFGAAYYFIPRFDPTALETMNTNQTDIAALRDEIAGIDTSAGIAPVLEQVATLNGQITDQAAAFASLDERIASFDARLLTLEKQPSSDGTLQDAALQAYQAELDGLRTQVEEQAGAALAQLETTRAEAAAIEQAATSAARNAKGHAALAQIRSALETGAPMMDALAELADVMGTDAPEALVSVAEGVPTLATLQDGFPPAARQALADARSEGASGETTGAFGSFLREQLNVRSVAPREGDDADAILSRAEAALKIGQLDTAITEISALPDVAAAPLAGWVDQAKARAAALAAANEISISLNDN